MESHTSTDPSTSQSTIEDEEYYDALEEPEEPADAKQYPTAGPSASVILKQRWSEREQGKSNGNP